MFILQKGSAEKVAEYAKKYPEIVETIRSSFSEEEAAEFMAYLKGKSTLMLFDRHPEFRSNRGDRHFWARGYFVATVGNVNEETILNYIRTQEENDKRVTHHFPL